MFTLHVSGDSPYSPNFNIRSTARALICLVGEKECGDGSGCYHPKSECNGIHDCVDGTDEMNCTSLWMCSDFEYQCEDGSGCYNSESICDGNHDCTDWGDEMHCSSSPACLDSEIECGDGSGCYNPKSECNGISNCRDGTDEMNCTSRLNSSPDLSVQGNSFMTTYRIIPIKAPPPNKRPPNF